MQITHNQTGMVAAVTVVCDPEGADRCLVVIKGTFIAGPHGSLSLADQQLALVTCDEHHGDPASSPVRYESDFAPSKPRVDVLVNGHAFAPGGVPAASVPVRLELPGSNKDVIVVGERRWVQVAGELFASDPVPFTQMPLRFDRAFGGSDDSRGPDRVAVEPRNMVGVGYHPHRAAALIEGQPVANLERPGRAICSPRAAHDPVGFGVVGRGWAPRVGYAGTYDQRWRDQRAPYLPADFDPAYYQAAPADQQLASVRGGERIRCVHMAPDPVVSFVLPSPRLAVRYLGVSADHRRQAKLDTIILEPHLARAQLVWRCSAPLGRKPSDMRAIVIGDALPAPGPRGTRGGKPHFRSLGDAVQTLRARRAAATVRGPA